jgi:hypothetical protein
MTRSPILIPNRWLPFRKRTGSRRSKFCRRSPSFEYLEQRSLLTSITAGTSNVLRTAQDVADYVFGGYQEYSGVKYPISIAQVINPGVANTYLVALSGTDLRWNQTTGLVEDITAELGIPDLYSNTVINDVVSAVPSGATLILAGHSLGGMEAQNLVPQLIGKGYQISVVETFGSPETGIGVQGPKYMEFATPTDPVARLDPVAVTATASLAVSELEPSVLDQALLAATRAASQRSRIYIDATGVAPVDLIGQHLSYPDDLELKNFDALGEPITNGQGSILELGQTHIFTAPLFSSSQGPPIGVPTTYALPSGTTSVQNYGEYLLYGTGPGKATSFDLVNDTQHTYTNLAVWSNVQQLDQYLFAYDNSGNLSIINLFQGSSGNDHVGNWTSEQQFGDFLCFENPSAGTATVVNLDTGTQKTYNIGPWAWSAVVQDQEDLCFENATAGTAVIVNLFAQTQKTYNIGTWNELDQVGDDLCFENQSSGTSTVVNPLAGSQTTYHVGAWWTQVQQVNDDLCFESNESVAVVNLDAGTEHTYQIGAWSAIYQIGDYLCFGEEQEATNGVGPGTMTVLDLDTGGQHTYNVGFWTQVEQVGDYLCLGNEQSETNGVGPGTMTILDLDTGTQRAYNVGFWIQVEQVGDYLCLGNEQSETNGVGPGTMTILNLDTGTQRAYNVGFWTQVEQVGDYLCLGNEESATNGVGPGTMTILNLDAGVQQSYNVGYWYSLQQVGSLLCFENPVTDTVQVVNTAQGTQQKFVLQPWNDAWQGGDDLCFASSNGSSVTVLNLDTATQQTYNIGAWSEVNQIGDYLFFSSTNGKSVSVLNLSPVYGNSQSTVTVSSSPGSSVYGQTVVFTATVAAESGAGRPTGSVLFYDGSLIIGVAALPASGADSATLDSTSLSVGNNSITAIYSGDVAFGSSQSSAVTVVVSKAITKTSLTSSISPSVYGQAIVLTAAVSATAPGAGMPTGTVSFYNGTTLLDTATLPAGGADSVAFTYASLPVGSDSITAVYSGDANFSTSTGMLTQAVQKAATAVTLTSSANSSVYGQSVTFTATVAAAAPGAGRATGTVSFYNGSTLLGTKSLPASGAESVTFVYATPPVGSNSITAVYSGDTNFGISTGKVAQVVQKGATTTVLTSSKSATVYGQSVTLTAVVAAIAPGARGIAFESNSSDPSLGRDWSGGTNPGRASAILEVAGELSALPGTREFGGPIARSTVAKTLRPWSGPASDGFGRVPVGLRAGLVAAGQDPFAHPQERVLDGAERHDRNAGGQREKNRDDRHVAQCAG